MKVEDIMTREVITLCEDDTLRDAINSVQRNHIRHIPIVDGKRLIGVVSDRDIKRATPSLYSGISQEKFNEMISELSLSRVMTRDPFSISSDTSIKEVVQLMISKKYGALPVVDSGELVGIVTGIDCLRVLERML